MTSLLQTGSIKGQAPEDFGFSKTDKLADEIATAWGDAKAYWAAFQRALERLATDDLTDVTDELTVGYRDQVSVTSATKSVAKEAALLSLKIVDPACGSGHFLLAAFSIFRQLPVLPPKSYTPEDIEFISRIYRDNRSLQVS